MTLLRTWPYGTTRKGKVVETSANAQLVIDENGLGHILVGGAGDATGKVGDTGVLRFTKGGPTGGYWKFHRTKRGRR